MHDLPVAGRLLAQPPYSDVLQSPEQFLPVLVGESAARAIDLSQPIDGAIGFAKPPTGAVAFRVRAAEAGKLVGREAGGRLRLVPAQSAPLRACELWRSPQPRLICASNAAALETYAPALAGLAPPASDASLVLEASGPTYQKSLGELLDAQKERLEATETPSERTGREIAAEVMRHDKLTIEVGLTPRGIELATALGYTSKRSSPLLQSWLEGGLSPKALPVAPVPGNFSLSYAGSAMFEKLWDATLDSVLEDLSESTTATQQELQEARAIIDKLTPATGRFAYSSGANVPAALAALEHFEAEKSTPAQRRKLDRALGAWWVVALDTDPKSFLDGIEAALKLNQRDLKDKPGKGQPPKVRATSSSLTQARSVPKGLPAGSLHFLDTVTPKKDFVPDEKHPRQDQHVNHIFVVPDAARSRVVIAVSRVEEVAGSKALTALGNTPVAPAPGPLLAARLTPGGVASLGASFDSAEEAADAKRDLLALQKLPSKGQQELDLTNEIRRLAGTADGLELRIAVRLSTAAASEWLAFTESGMAKRPKP
jgi:hypothetical protein